MAPSRRSRRREKTSSPEPEAEAPTACKLPADLLREIIARSNHRTLIRFAAACNLLRRDILSPPFDPRVIDAAPCILVYLCADVKKSLDLVHPITPAALSFCYKHLSGFLTRKAVGSLLDEYKPVSSRRGIVVLRRRNIMKGLKSDSSSDLCVYDPMSDARSFFSSPAEIQSDEDYEPKYILLTAADGGGIDRSFMLLVFDFHKGNRMTVHTASSRGTWRSVTVMCRGWSLKKRGEPAILSGGVIHWLPYYVKQIVSYNLGTGRTGSVELPPTNCNVNYGGNQLYLATSSDQKLLKLFTIEGFMMYVWIQLPVSAEGGSDYWSLEDEIDMEEKLRSLDPHITGGPDGRIEFEGSGRRTGDVVFLVEVRRKDYRDVYSDALIVFDLETKKMHLQKQGLSLLEIDLPSRLQTMKIFS